LEIVTVEEFIHYITPAVISGTRELLPERCVGTSGIVPDIYTDSNSGEGVARYCHGRTSFE
jgi:hypothetical protein